MEVGRSLDYSNENDFFLILVTDNLRCMTEGHCDKFSYVSTTFFLS